MGGLLGPGLLPEAVEHALDTSEVKTRALGVIRPILSPACPSPTLCTGLLCWSAVTVGVCRAQPHTKLWQALDGQEVGKIPLVVQSQETLCLLFTRPASYLCPRRVQTRNKGMTCRRKQR